jgi:hypothetical protein
MVPGELKQCVKAYLEKNPSATGREIHESCGGSYSGVCAAAVKAKKELGIKSVSKFEERRNFIIQKLANGSTQKEIAAECGISQAYVSEIQRKAAMSYSESNDEPEKPKSVSVNSGTRSFMFKASSSRDDAREAWRDVGKTAVEAELAADAAELAAAAWKEAALKLRNRK